MAGDPSNLALYRKYRPATFAEVKGQDHVTLPLRQALLAGRVHHAYLFSGPRGCGKTSSARILARSLNCEQGPTPDPCGKCDSCIALAPGGPGSIDVIEIDAASHGGVDDARDLRERAFYAPVSGRYKVYIIDEAHMVTREGFNALLKVVEEPPPHLKFVFATTEPEKVIGTIRSRTHHYPFRLVAPPVLRELIEQILDAEGVESDPAVLPLVVRAGAGSARDALSVLDQLLAGSDESGISYPAAVSLLGYTDASLLDATVDAFAAGDGSAVFGVVDQVVSAGHDPRRFAADLLDRLRDLIVLGAVRDADRTGLLDVPADQLERMREQVAKFGTAELTRAAEVLNAGLTEMRGAASPRLLLELTCARVLLPAAEADEAALLARLERIERRLAVGGTGGRAKDGTGVGGLDGAGQAAANPPAGDRASVPVAQETRGSARQAPASKAPQAPASKAPSAPRAPTRRAVSAPPAGAAPSAEPAASAEAAASAKQAASAEPPGSAGAAASAGTAASVETAPSAAAAPSVQSAVSAEPTAAAEPEASAAPAGHGEASAEAAANIGPGQLDADSLRRDWDAILDAVRHVRKVSWIQLSKATVASLAGNVLTLEFARDGDLKGFTASRSDALVAKVLYDRFGVEWRIQGVAGSDRGRSEASGLLPGHDQVTVRVPKAQQSARQVGGASSGASRGASGGSPNPSPSQESSGPSAPQGAREAKSQRSQEAKKPSGSEAPPEAASPAEDLALEEPELDAYGEDVDPALTGLELITRELGGQIIGEIVNAEGSIGPPSSWPAIPGQPYPPDR